MFNFTLIYVVVVRFIPLFSIVLAHVLCLIWCAAFLYLSIFLSLLFFFFSFEQSILPFILDSNTRIRVRAWTRRLVVRHRQFVSLIKNKQNTNLRRKTFSAELLTVCTVHESGRTKNERNETEAQAQANSVHCAIVSWNKQIAFVMWYLCSEH